MRTGIINYVFIAPEFKNETFGKRYICIVKSEVKSKNIKMNHVQFCIVNSSNDFSS